ncbi:MULTISPECIES: class I SAM-dependent methyltransferase [Oxalobacteraceae]|uniref:class I SAM-dependent methyltransferase n=1 Tax=Oxalobacteraceae TaxID=75682 RepID=UPI0010A4D675|nr:MULTISPECIES: class I SAM-dependent methyltransferase [Oxalobacteraceae]
MTDQLNAISKTAYYTCALRVLDTLRPNPICNDTYAARFMTEEGKAISARITASPGSQSGTTARHRIIDDLLRDTLKADPNTAVVIVGCGFDTRAYRIPGGQWHEIDESPVIDLKNKILPTSECGNTLRRIGVGFSSESLESRLPSIDGSLNIVVIVEGVFYYLTDAQTNATLSALRKKYPKHTLVCDLMDRTVATRYSKEIRHDIEKLGAKWLSTPNEPVHTIERAGYRLRSSILVIEKILDFKKAGRIERFLARLLLPKLIRGIGVYVFEPASA